MTMKSLDGIAASAGIAIGKAMLLDNEELRVPSHPIPKDQIANEIMPMIQVEWTQFMKGRGKKIQAMATKEFHGLVATLVTP